MEKVNVLPQFFFKFYCDKELAVDVANKVKLLPYVTNEHNDISATSLNHMKDFNLLHGWFSECLDKVKDELQVPFEKIVVTETWSNRSIKTQWHHGHVHFNSYLSGIFYLSTSETGRTWFSINNFWYDFFLIENNLSKNFINDKKLILHKESPEFGKLILFPSNIFHSVEEHNDEHHRYSIAFNTFPNIKITNNTYYLNINNTPKHCLT